MFKERLHPVTIHSILKQQEHRPSWEKADSPEHLDDLIVQEAEIELEEAIELCELGAPPEFLISELGDGIYLTVRRESKYPDIPMSERAARAVERVFALCDELGLNPNYMAMMKVLRNDWKYPHSISNNGFSYSEGMQFSKSLYSSLTGGHGDYLFYAIWEAHGEQFCHDIPEQEPSKAIVPYVEPRKEIVVYQAR